MMTIIIPGHGAVEYTVNALVWSMIGFAAGVVVTLMIIWPWTVSRLRKDERLNEGVPESRDGDDREEEEGPLSFVRKWAGPLILALAVASASQMAWYAKEHNEDARRVNEQTQCLATFIEDVRINLADTRALGAQDRALLDNTIKRLVDQSNDNTVYIKLLNRLRAGESAETVLADLFQAASFAGGGNEILQDYLTQRARIEEERMNYPLPPVPDNCLQPGEQRKVPSVPTTLPSDAPTTSTPGVQPTPPVSTRTPSSTPSRSAKP